MEIFAYTSLFTFKIVYIVEKDVHPGGSPIGVGRVKGWRKVSKTKVSILFCFLFFPKQWESFHQPSLGENDNLHFQQKTLLTQKKTTNFHIIITCDGLTNLSCYIPQELNKITLKLQETVH